MSRVHFVRIDENSLRYCVTRLDEPIPAFTREAVETWAWATDTLAIGLRADPVSSGGPKTAVRVRRLRAVAILGAIRMLDGLDGLRDGIAVDSALWNADLPDTHWPRIPKWTEA